MQLNFIYNEQKDMECLLTKGASSINSPKSTKTYEALLEQSNPDNEEEVKKFIQNYLKENKIDPIAQALKQQQSWRLVAPTFEERALKVFGEELTGEMNAFLTITGRYPYSIEGRYFYVSAAKDEVNATVMHELWHFYTWEKFSNQVPILGAERFNDLKEALTVLLNGECLDLMKGIEDKGYNQHQELRKIMIDEWVATCDIDQVWKKASDLI